MTNQILIGLYAGTFDPPTFGHLDIIERASRLCSRLIIGVGKNSSKPHPLLPMDERVKALKKMTDHLHQIECCSFDGLTLTLAQSSGANVLIRGLRSSADLANEYPMARAHQELWGLETIFLLANGVTGGIHSSVIRDLIENEASISAWVPAHVEDLLRKHL